MGARCKEFFNDVAVNDFGARNLFVVTKRVVSGTRCNTMKSFSVIIR